MTTRLLIAACCLLVALGCGRGGGTPEPPMVHVEGTVSLDGKPLKEGKIYFVSPQRTGMDEIDIKDGKFDGQARSGKRFIQFGVFKPGEPYKGMPKSTPAPVNILPSKYTVESKMSEEVKPSGDSKFDFKLTSS